MFDGVPADQFYQFIASTRSSSTAPSVIPLSFPLHATTTNFPTTFDPSSNNINYPPSQSLHFLHPLHPNPTKDHHHHHEATKLDFISTNLELERERSVPEAADPWSNDEVLTLLRIRSSMENWFPDSTWEHVSRKLGELGFKRSAEKCKEKFEEESRFFNSINNYSKNYRFFSELEEQVLFHGAENTTHHLASPVTNNIEKGHEKMDKKENEAEEEEDKRNEKTRIVEEEAIITPSGHVEEDRDKVAKKSKSKKNKKRKRQQRFEMLMGFCEDIVNKMIAQQQELHEKLIEDMMKREEENIAREEAWKKQEMDRINKEIEIRAHEQAIAGDRQAAIIEFLKKFTSHQDQGSHHHQKNQCSSNIEEGGLILKVPNNSIPPINSYELDAQQNPSTSNVPTSLNETLALQNPTSSTLDPTIPKVPISSNSPNPNSLNTQNNPLALPSSFSTNNQNPNFASSDDKDHGKRWPRDEVLALINLRCSLNNSGEDNKELLGGANNNKVPLWERISQGMLELGYKRSAKRCKEKWENINKYFRKTKDANKKRSLDSRTCPYFHQLSNLYKQGTLVAPSEDQGPENRSSSLENHSDLSETHRRFSPQGVNSDATNMLVADQGEKSILQVPAFDFEF